MESRLRIKPLPAPPEKQKITFRLPVPVLETFNTYLAVYKEIYGQDPSPDFVAEQIFSSFFELDRAFAAYVKQGSEAEQTKPKKERKRAVLPAEPAAPVDLVQP
ncbi:DUF2274 domain-containing protein [Geomonas paludis]|uniref:DUF2274 domain-containing protein n=1 Tax=Geomonas paludis TaxID=2740185 RepID=A0A6V8MUP2_9BACT|nr:DUF2274 domain-containing protein [Geomonas paludis]GFO63604.1 hypothetical protein GMPD_15230 [Geomonas paludis]